ncbi:MAG TPA: magnesium-translocating P-type ATPase [Cyclobacteriaceae bacterium]|nr:magnesium-translocating P-type ATPase [Cyclobacteriaceae bacterium]
MMDKPIPFWSILPKEVINAVNSTDSGLSDEAAIRRRKGNLVRKPLSPFITDLFLLFRQFKSPLVSILIFAVILASILGEYGNSSIILAIILLSGILGFWQERNANRALEKLRAMVRVNATIVREGIAKDVPISEIVSGDIVLLNAGDIIPGDCLLLEANDLHVNEAALTGESFPAEKALGILPIDTVLSKRKNCVFQGTSVVNGTAKALVVHTGIHTEFGKISTQIEKHQPETAFEKGIRKFGYMIMRVTLILSLLILVLNIFLGKPVTDSILFALALAVGMAPELLPAIMTITLSAGAKRMAEKKVIVKKLSSIQNLGAVNVFCSDKTGTLTEGIIKVQHTVDGEGNPCDKVRNYAFLNANLETGFTNPMDEAIRNIPDVPFQGYEKMDEVPYDFIRKRLSIAVSFQDKHLLITKGAVNNILDVCTTAEFAHGETIALEQVRNQIKKTQEDYCARGFRTIGLCYKDITGDPVIDKNDECEMTFLGIVVLSDSLKAGISDTIKNLKGLGIQLKLITGDHELVAAYISSRIGLKSDDLLTGSRLRKMTDEALAIKVNEVNVFAETEPDQKERIVRALQKAGNVVGYIGDGINDASALQAADVGISVDTAVDVARETADIVFLQNDLNVLREGILEGRRTFINTLKYIFITISANFGNMFSVAGTSLFLPFLPLLPKQILLLNFLSDFPAMAISSDAVDPESLSKPQRWNTKFIRNFMIVFGIESSLFDFITFGTLLYFFHADVDHFRTGWFLESVITEIIILLIIRTRRPFMKSKPSKYLIWTSALVAILTIALPYLPYSNLLGLDPLPLSLILGIITITIIYVITAEFTKQLFFKSKITARYQ